MPPIGKKGIDWSPPPGAHRPTPRLTSPAWWRGKAPAHPDRNRSRSRPRRPGAAPGGWCLRSIRRVAAEQARADGPGGRSPLAEVGPIGLHGQGQIDSGPFDDEQGPRRRESWRRRGPRSGAFWSSRLPLARYCTRPTPRLQGCGHRGFELPAAAHPLDRDQIQLLALRVGGGAVSPLPALAQQIPPPVVEGHSAGWRRSAASTGSLLRRIVPPAPAGLPAPWPALAATTPCSGAWRSCWAGVPGRAAAIAGAVGRERFVAGAVAATQPLAQCPCCAPPDPGGFFQAERHQSSITRGPRGRDSRFGVDQAPHAGCPFRGRGRIGCIRAASGLVIGWR